MICSAELSSGKNTSPKRFPLKCSLSLIFNKGSNAVVTLENFKFPANQLIDSIEFQLSSSGDSLGNNWELWDKSILEKNSYQEDNGEFFVSFTQDFTIANFDTGSFTFPPSIAFFNSKKLFSNSLEFTIKLDEIDEKASIKNIMILGGGRIGYNTARELCQKKFNVTILEKNKKKAYEIADLLPNALVINGDGRNAELLDEENLTAMDAFIAVTENSETNIMSCLMAVSYTHLTLPTKA